MTTLRVLLWRLRGLFGSRRLDADLDDELATHFDLATAEYRQRGLSLEEARLAARRDLGSVARTKDLYRDQRVLVRLDAFWQDIRFGMRSLAKRRLLLIAATLSIGVGVGLNVSVYGALTRLFDANLSGAPRDERLVSILGEISFLNYQDLRTTDAFTDVAAMQVATLLWRSETGTSQLGAKVVSTNFFDVLQVRSGYGRTFEGTDSQTVLLGFGFWQRRFGGDPTVMGKTLNLNGWPYLIGGILPQDFNPMMGPLIAPDLYVPISPQVCRGLSNRAAPQFDLVARLRPDVTAGQAARALTARANELARRFPREDASLARSLAVVPATGFNVWRLMPAGRVMLTAAATLYAVIGLVLLVACANVAGLLLARAEERRREIAVCAALGATRWQLAQRFVAESAIIAVFGSIAGVAFYEIAIATITRVAWAAGGLNVIRPPLPLIYCCGLVLLVTVACGLAPALSVNQMAPGSGLAGGFARGRRRLRFRNVLVVSQVSVCFVLLSGAFLLLHALVMLRGTDPGFDIVHTLSVNVRMPPSDTTSLFVLFERISRTMKNVPGIESVSCVRHLPLAIFPSHASVHTETAVDTHRQVSLRPVGPQFLETMGISLIRGRDLSGDDLSERRRTVTAIVVNETLARRFFGGPDAIGRRLVLETLGGQGDDRRLEVIGVARDSKWRTLNEDPEPVVYLPELTTSFIVRVAGPATAAVRSVEQAVAASETGASVQASPIAARVAFALLPARIGGGVLGALSAVGLLMAMLGLYAVVTHAVNRRTFELGVRIALGATRGVVLRMIVADGLLLVAIGCAIGGIASLVLARALSPLLAARQGLVDPLALTGVLATLFLIGLLASVWPARRAARVDPVMALRSE